MSKREQARAKADRTYRAVYQIGIGATSQQIEILDIDHLPFCGWEYGPQELPDGSRRYGVCIAVERM